MDSSSLIPDSEGGPRPASQALIHSDDIDRNQFPLFLIRKIKRDRSQPRLIRSKEVFLAPPIWPEDCRLSGGVRNSLKGLALDDHIDRLLTTGTG